MACEGWQKLNIGCQANEAAKSLAGSAVESLANAVMEATGKVITSLGTVWVYIGTPNLTRQPVDKWNGELDQADKLAVDPGISTVINYVTWIAMAIAILSLFILGAMIASKMRAGEGVMAVGRVGMILVAVVLVSGSSSIVGGLIANGPANTSTAVGFIQSSLWWYMGAAAVVSVIIGGLRMAWEQRADAGKELVKSLLTLVVVAGAGVGIIGTLLTASDAVAVSIINSSLTCDVSADTACFGANITALLALSAVPGGPGGGMGPFLLIVLGLFAILASLVQIVLMVARGGMLVILAGILPLSASFTNTEMGKGWFRKCVSWSVALILYKPAAAIVYAAAFQLVGTKDFSDDGSGILAVLTGLMLMVIALVAMPALMKFVTPMVGSLAGGAGAGLAVGAAAALPSGAQAIGRLGSDASGESGASGSPGGAGPGGSPGGQGEGAGGGGGSAPTGNDAGGGGDQGEDGAQTPGGGTAGGSAGGEGAGGAGTDGGSAGGEVAGGGGGSTARWPQPNSGSAGGGGSPIPTEAGSGTPIPTGGEAGGAGAGAAGEAAAGGTAAGGAAAATPVGAAAMAAKEGMDKGIQATQDLADDATGDGGPDGSN